MLRSLLRPGLRPRAGGLGHSKRGLSDGSVTSQVLEATREVSVSDEETIKSGRGRGQALRDKFDRQHTYLRISLTERCNLRCELDPGYGLFWVTQGMAYSG